VAHADELLGQFDEFQRAYQRTHRGVSVLGLTTDNRLPKIDGGSEFIRENLAPTAKESTPNV
jgi:hypothetical protein